MRKGFVNILNRILFVILMFVSLVSVGIIADCVINNKETPIHAKSTASSVVINYSYTPLSYVTDAKTFSISYSASTNSHSSGMYVLSFNDQMYASGTYQILFSDGSNVIYTADAGEWRVGSIEYRPSTSDTWSTYTTGTVFTASAYNIRLNLIKTWTAKITINNTSYGTVSTATKVVDDGTEVYCNSSTNAGASWILNFSDKSYVYGRPNSSDGTYQYRITACYLYRGERGSTGTEYSYDMTVYSSTNQIKLDRHCSIEFRVTREAAVGIVVSVVYSPSEDYFENPGTITAPSGSTLKVSIKTFGGVGAGFTISFGSNTYYLVTKDNEDYTPVITSTSNIYMMKTGSQYDYSALSSGITLTSSSAVIYISCTLSEKSFNYNYYYDENTDSATQKIYQLTRKATATSGAALTFKGETYTRTGYTQIGWATTSGSSTVEYEFGAATPKETLTLYPVWRGNEYTISYNSNGGSEVADVTYLCGDTITAPTAPTKNGYIFEDWYSDEALTTAYTFSTMPAKNFTLYAKWTENDHTITFNSNGGSEVSSITQQVGTTVTKPTDPSKKGNTFSGWYSDEALTTAYTFSTMPDEDITLYAKWTLNKYTITFNSNEGSSVTAITADYGSAITKPTDPTKSGYTFAGWYSDAALTTAYTFSTMPAENITLYAKWTPNKYTITFNSNEGSSVTAITADYGAKVTKPTDPTKSGYTFAGWYSDSALTTAYTFSTMPAENITLYAKWTINAFTITSVAGEGTSLSAPTEGNAGGTISFEAALLENYKDLTITVYKTGDEGTTIAVTGGKFVMPSYAVTIETSALPIVKIADDNIPEGELPEVVIGDEVISYPYDSPDIDAKIYKIEEDGTKTLIDSLDDADEGNYIIEITGTSSRVPEDSEFTFTISKTEITIANVKTGYTGVYEYNNAVPEFADLIIEVDGKTLSVDTDYILTAYDKNVGEGYDLMVTGTGHYYGEFHLTYQITKKETLDDTIEIKALQKEGEVLVYSGTSEDPTIVIFVNDEESDEGYSVKYYTDDTKTKEIEGPVNAGSYYAEVTTEGRNFEPVTLGVTFDISKAVYDMSDVTFPDVTCNEDGNTKSLKVEGTLPEGLSVTVTYYSDAAHSTSVDSDSVSDEGTYYGCASFKGDDNHEAVENMYAVLTVGPALYIEIKDGSEYTFIMLKLETETYEYDGESFTDETAYRKSYSELGMTHGTDDKTFEKVVIGNVSPDTSISVFLSNIKTDSSLLVIKNSSGEVIYENGHITQDQLDVWADEGISEEQFMTDTFYYAVGTGNTIEYVKDGTVMDTVIISVLGDTDCDGLLTAADYGIVKMNIVDTSLKDLPLEVLLACYVENDGSTPENAGTNYYGTIKSLIVESGSTSDYFNENPSARKTGRNIQYMNGYMTLENSENVSSTVISSGNMDTYEEEVIMNETYETETVSSENNNSFVTDNEIARTYKCENVRDDSKEEEEE